MLDIKPMAKNDLADFLANGEPTTAEYFKASIKDGFDNSTVGVALDYAKETLASGSRERASDKQAHENINAYYEGRKPEVVDPSSPQLKTYTRDDWANSPYFRKGIDFQDGWSEERAKYIAEGFDDKEARNFTLEKGSSGAWNENLGTKSIGFVGQMIGGLPDPINLIPFGGAASKTAKIGEKLVRAGIEGAIGNIAVSAVTRPYWDKRGTDSDWSDYVNDVWIGGVMGGGFGLAGHGASKAFDELRFNKADVQLKDQAPLAQAGDTAINAMAKGEELELAKVPNLQKAYDSIYDIPEVQRSRKVQDLTDQLTEHGYSVDEAKTHISPIVAQAEAFSRDFNMSMDDFLEKYGPTFQKSEFKDGKILKIDPNAPKLNELLDSEIQTMAQEVQFAEKGGQKIFDQGQFVGSAGDGSFPSWYKDSGIKNAEHLSKVLESKKGPVYERLQAIAEDRLLNGYETPTSRSAPSNEYRDLVGQNKAEIPLGADGQPLFKRTDGKERGAITFDEEGKAIIHLFENADSSTIIHETGHLFLNNLEKFSTLADAPATIKNDFAVIKSWMGVKDGGPIEVRHHEKFARGFEQFLREGVAPRPELQSVFNRFKDWLTSIYKSSDQLKAKLSDDARGIYSRLLGSDSRPKVEAMPEVKAPEPVFKNEADVEARTSEIQAMAESNSGVATPEEINTFQNSINEIDVESKALDEVATFFQGAKDDKSIQEAANRVGITKTQFEKIIDDFNQRLMNEDEARLGIEKLIEQRKIDLASEAKELKRQAFLALSARAEVINHVSKVMEAGATPKQAILSILEGDSSLRGVQGAGKSVDGSYMALAQSTSAKCFSELRKVDAKIENLFESDIQFNQRVVKEMITPGSTGDELAKKSGEILSRYSDELRQRANIAGSKIGKLEGHVPRTHDVEKLIGNQAAWTDFMMKNLDPEKSLVGLGDIEKGKALDEIYASLVTDNHATKEIDPIEPLRRVPRNIAKAKGESRSLHFVSAEAEMNYLKQFGQGDNILQSMSMHYESMSRNIALMERLGPNPENTIAHVMGKITEDYKKQILDKKTDPALVDKHLTDMGKVSAMTSRDSDIGHAMMQALGEVSSQQGWFKNASQIIRGWNSLTKLGSALLSQPTDFVHAVNERRLLSDQNEAAHWIDVFKDYFSSPSKDEQDVLDHLGIFVDGINYKNFNKFDADNINNKLARANDWMFRWSGQNWHVKHSKFAAGLSLSRELGANISKSWKDVHPGLREMLVQYGSFDQKKWELMQKASPLDLDGKAYFHPGLLNEIPDDAFDGMVHQDFGNSSKPAVLPIEGEVSKDQADWEKGRATEIKRARFKLEMDLKTFFVEESRNAAPEPDAKIRRIMSFGTKSGTKTNEAIKLLTQFKTFAFVNYDRSIKGKRMMKNENDYGGLVHHAVATLALGYLSTVLKDLAKGTTPADPTMSGTWGRAAMQSGGLGIMGDFFGSAYSARSGSDVLSSMAGPTISTLANTSVLALKGVHKETYDDGSKYAAKWVDVARSLAPAPFSTLWYTRAAMDHLVWQNLKETLEPGSISRSQKRLKKEYNQKYIVSP